MATSQQKCFRFEGRSAIFVVLGIVGLLANTCFGLDPHQSLGRFRLVGWDEDQGLPENYTSNIAQTKDGFIWLAYHHGLIRFDGRNFATGEELQANIELPGKVFGLVTGPAGELWIGSYRALYCRLANGDFERFDSKDGLPNDYLSALCLDREGTLWIGTDSHGLFQLKAGRFSSYPGSIELAQHFIYAMCETESAFWIGTALGAYEIDKVSGAIRKFTAKDGLPGDQVYGITVDRKGGVWAGTGNGWRDLTMTGRFEPAGSELAGQPIQSLMTDSEGMLWASGSSGGVWRVDPDSNQVSGLPVENNRPLPDIQSVLSIQSDRVQQ